MKILPFEPRPCSRIILDAGRITQSPFADEIGTHRYFLTFQAPDGCSLGVWDGDSRSDALAAASQWIADGCRLIDHTEGGAA